MFVSRESFNRKLIAWLSAIITATTLFQSSASARGASPQETVVYVSNRPANWDIYLFDSPATKPRRLTDDPSLDYNAVFSPDGRWVVFCSERRGNPDLFVLDLKKTGGPRLLVGTDAMEDAPAISPDGRHLAFVSTRDGNADIFLLPFRPESPAPASAAINLTKNHGGDFNPSFSPDGRAIIFSSDRDEYTRATLGKIEAGSEIYTMGLDGSSQKRLTESKGWDGSPVFSSDGKTIYFYSERAGGLRVWRMNSDGSGAAAVSPEKVKAMSPAVSPDGRVAFSIRAGNRWQIASTDTSGAGQRSESDSDNEYFAPDFDRKTGRMICHGNGPVGEQAMFDGPYGRVPFVVAGIQDQRRLPDRTLLLHATRGAVFASFDQQSARMVIGFDQLMVTRIDGTEMSVIHKPEKGAAWSPSWSKDGKWIAFTVGPPFAGPQAPCDIWRMKSDGSEAINLTADSKLNDAFPAFSPDGRLIVFRSGRDGNQEIYLMGADGTNPRRLTDDPATDTMPAFSPRGDEIAFSSNRDGDYEIYTLGINADGSAGRLRRITTSPRFDTHPHYSPDGRWLLINSERGGFNDEGPLVQEALFNPAPFGEVFAVRLADGYTVRLTHNKWEDGLGVWKPVRAVE